MRKIVEVYKLTKSQEKETLRIKVNKIMNMG